MNTQFKSILQEAIQAFQRGNFDSAHSILNEALKSDIGRADVIFELGVAYVKAGKFSEALNIFFCLQSHKKSDARVPYNIGLIYVLQGKHKLAIEAYDLAIKIQPKDVEALINKGSAYNEIKEYVLALECLNKAIQIRPDIQEAWCNKGIALSNLNLYQESIESYDEAIKLNPEYYEAWSNKSVPLNKLGHFLEASQTCDKALSLKPDHVEAWANKGVALNELKRYQEAIVHYDKALSLKPDHVEAWANKGFALNFLKDHAKSAECYFNALESRGGSSGDLYLLGTAHHQMMLGCNWVNYENITHQIFYQISQEKKCAEPFGLQGISKSEEILRRCAEIYSDDRYPVMGNLVEHCKYQHNKVRIGYLCGEFRDQATSVLMAGVWESYDKSKFEIFAFDNGWDDGSKCRKRIERTFSNIFDISKLSDFDAANLIKINEIDVLVNLNGYFGQARQGIFSYKPAPIQVNYLGFPGTIGANCIDYMIADKVVLPEKSKKYYAEKIVYIPNSYQANDNKKIISKKIYSKADFGLPENGFIFACFNNNYKITPETFDLWCRILTKVQSSVLWILADNLIAKNNLVKEAASRGIESNRLIFARRLDLADHLARHRLADLFLDTFPYNAHTTGSDALWAGLPILTLMGETFPGRVAASLLSAIGLPELITKTQEEYEAMAIELAMNPNRLADIKLKLSNNRLTAPLFDTPLFTKNLEAAYLKMYERYQADLQPDHITIV